LEKATKISGILSAREWGRDYEENEMKHMPLAALALAIGLVITLNAQAFRSPDDVPRMRIEELKQRMDDPSLVIIDVRTPHDWAHSTMKMKGAIREDPSKMDSWMAKYPPNKILLFYCA
jgi:hypothetical protein